MDWLKPEYFKFVIVGIALAILWRSAEYLIADEPLMFFSLAQAQPAIDEILGVEMPYVVMSILWPVVFAFSNLIHSNLRISSLFFYSVIAVHTVTCLLAAYLIFSQEFDSVNLQFGEELLKIHVVYAVLGATAISVIFSIFVYHRNILLFGSEGNTRPNN